MLYKIELKIEVEEELNRLSNAQKILVYKQFNKISKSPELGRPLGNKNNYDLSV